MSASAPSKKRLLPGILIVGIQWILWLILPAIFPELFMISVAASALGTVAFLIWWLFFSKYPAMERWGSLLLMVLAVILFSFLIHESIDTGNMGLMYYMYVLPNICLAVLLALVISRNLQPLAQKLILAACILLAPGTFAFLRSDGLDGEGRAMLNWRWAGTDEERLLAVGEDAWKKEDTREESGNEAGDEAVWPGFRGPGRNSVVAGSAIATDWENEAPELLWKQAVGPGCSSFAILGDRVYTQEQRGEEELVSCYQLHTGALIWKHSDHARFYDSHAGAGPRATPTLAGGKVYSLGGTGILNVLDAESGTLLWSRQTAEETGMEALTWGFCASPLVYGDAVIIALAGKILAYHRESGELLWEGSDGGNSYSSPQLFTIEGVPQVLFMSKMGCTSLNPENGVTLWTHDWEISDRILQPAMTAEGKLLLAGEMHAFRCLNISQEARTWELNVEWTNGDMKLNFNDLVVHKKHAYGFDGPYLVCLDLETGIRTWKGKRYRGWILLLAEQDLLLILSEKGKLALVEAKPGQFTELATASAIEGRTWNHPAMTGDILLVRNSREMAAFRLPSK